MGVGKGKCCRLWLRMGACRLHVSCPSGRPKRVRLNERPEEGTCKLNHTTPTSCRIACSSYYRFDSHKPRRDEEAARLALRWGARIESPRLPTAPRGRAAKQRACALGLHKQSRSDQSLRGLRGCHRWSSHGAHGAGHFSNLIWASPGQPHVQPPEPHPPHGGCTRIWRRRIVLGAAAE